MEADCVFGRRFLFSRTVISLCFIMRCIILVNTDVREIGLYDGTWVGSLPTFSIGMTTASDHASGDFPWVHDMLYSSRSLVFPSIPEQTKLLKNSTR